MKKLSLIALAPAFCLAAAACTSDGPLQPTPAGGGGGAVEITAPTALTPVGAEQYGFLQDQPITFTVRNGNVRAALNGTSTTAATYDFQVATDPDFSNLVVNQTGVAPGTDQTSIVAPRLPVGVLHWRARARANGTDGPFSAPGVLEIEPQGCHVVPGQEPSEELAEEIVFGCGDEFPELIAVTQDEEIALVLAEELLERTIWHLKLAGIEAARQRNPSGAISKDKVNVFIRGTWRTYDIYKLGFRNVPTEIVPFDRVFPEDPQPSDGIPD